MGDQIVPSHITHGKPHSPFYEGDHRNDDLLFLSVSKSLTWRAVLQGNAPRNVIQGPKSLDTSGRIYQVSKHTHLSRLR